MLIHNMNNYMKVYWTAEVVHETLRVLCEVHGDVSIASWDNFENRDVLFDGIRYVLDRPNVTPEELHENWKRFKISEGYVYGPVKDDIKKTHPNICNYNSLSPHEQSKDIIFLTLVNQLKDKL